MQLPAAGHRFTDEADGRVRVSAPDRQDGADIERQVEEPRPGLTKHRGGLIEQSFGLCGVAERKGDAGLADERVPRAPRDTERLNPSTLRVNNSPALAALPDACSMCPSRFSACTTIVLSSALRASSRARRARVRASARFPCV